MYLAKQFGRDCVDVSPTPPSRVERENRRFATEPGRQASKFLRELFVISTHRLGARAGL
jgi:hypothetical protein